MAKGGVAVVSCTEVNVGDIPAVNRMYVRSLTGTIQKSLYDCLSIQ